MTDAKDAFGVWVAREVGQDTSWGDFYAMGVAKGTEIQAGVVFNNMNESNCMVHIAVKQPSKMMLRLFAAVCDYAFNQCKLKRITGMVPISDSDVIAFDKRLGFREEFVMKDGANDGDMQVLVLTPADATRWLEMGNG